MGELDRLGDLFLDAQRPLLRARAITFLGFDLLHLSSAGAWGFSVILGSHHLLVKGLLLFFGKLLLIEGIDLLKN